MTSKTVTREQFEVRSELEVVHIPTGTVFRAHPHVDWATISTKSKEWRLSCCLNEQPEISDWGNGLRTCDCGGTIGSTTVEIDNRMRAVAERSVGQAKLAYSFPRALSSQTGVNRNAIGVADILTPRHPGTY